MLKILLIAFCCIAIYPIRNRSIDRLLGTVLGCLCILIFVGNNASPDQAAYLAEYNKPGSEYFEWGYNLVCTPFRKLGFSYLQFKVFASAFIILGLSLRFETIEVRHLSIVLLLWITTSFFFDAEQSRFFFASILVLCGTKFLEEKSFKNAILFSAFVLLSTQIHTLCYIYLLLLLVYCKEKVLFVLSAVGVATTLFVFLVLGNDLSIVGKILYKITKIERVKLWFGQSTRFGWLGPVAVQSGTFALLWYGKKVVDERKDTLSENTVSFYRTVYKISYALFFVLPLYCIATDFIRIIRGVMILYYVAVLLAFYHAKPKQKLFLGLGMVTFVLLFSVQGHSGILINNEYWNIFFTKNSFTWLR